MFPPYGAGLRNYPPRALQEAVPYPRGPWEPYYIASVPGGYIGYGLHDRVVVGMAANLLRIGGERADGPGMAAVRRQFPDAVRVNSSTCRPDPAGELLFAHARPAGKLLELSFDRRGLSSVRLGSWTYLTQWCRYYGGGYAPVPPLPFSG